MKTIRVQASLRRALKEDIFLPQNTFNPQVSELIRDNNVVFLWCPVRARFVGVQTLYSSQDIADALIPLQNGELFILKEKMDFCRDEYVFELCLELASGDQLKENAWLPRFGLVYFILQDNHSVSGPHHLSSSTDLKKLGENIRNNKIYLVSKQQSFREIIQAKTA